MHNVSCDILRLGFKLLQTSPEGKMGNMALRLDWKAHHPSDQQLKCIAQGPR